MVFQDYALYPHKSIYDNMALGLRLRKTPKDEIWRRVMDAAKLMHMTTCSIAGPPRCRAASASGWRSGGHRAPAQGVRLR